MSKSLGNFLTLSDLENQGFHPLDYRYLCLGAHYRKQLSFNLEILSSAKVAREKLVRQFLALGSVRVEQDSSLMSAYEKRFQEALAKDLGAPQALALVWILLKDSTLSAGEKGTLLERWDKVLGLSLRTFLRETSQETPQALSTDLQALLEERIQAKSNRNFARADEIRAVFQEKGYELIDSAQGIHWVKKGDKNGE